MALRRNAAGAGVFAASLMCVCASWPHGHCQTEQGYLFHLQLMIPAESAHDTVAALGDVGLLQFKDLNLDKSAFQRTYANQVKRCDEMARKIRFFHDQVTKAGLHATALRQ
jgi:hypothetical protein